jgi:hypothetical protein
MLINGVNFLIEKTKKKKNWLGCDFDECYIKVGDEKEGKGRYFEGIKLSGN